MGSRSRSWFGAPAPATALSDAPNPYRDPYLDPHTGLLANLFGACTTTELTAAGWWLDWTQLTGAINDAASRSAPEDHDVTALQEMFAPAPHRR